jgi:hypothetical protein
MCASQEQPATLKNSERAWGPQKLSKEFNAELQVYRWDLQAKSQEWETGLGTVRTLMCRGGGRDEGALSWKTSPTSDGPTTVRYKLIAWSFYVGRFVCIPTTRGSAIIKPMKRIRLLIGPERQKLPSSPNAIPSVQHPSSDISDWIRSLLTEFWITWELYIYCHNYRKICHKKGQIMSRKDVAVWTGIMCLEV